MSQPQILIVEDDPASSQYLSLALSEAGYAVRAAANGVEALLALESALPEVVISDLRMPEMDGLALLARLGQRWPEIPFILVTVEEDVSTVVEAVRLGAVNYLVKPVAPATLLAAVRKALSKHAGPAVADRKLPEIIGKSSPIVEVRHQVIIAAGSDVNVLVTGETGTGKELVARALHRCSKLARGPFIAHNCAATPQDLFESQFFGHLCGSFTGADRDHTGLLERADGGVLFLDELETLTPFHQAKLLRVIDDGEVRPVGASEARRVSVRFVAATNRDPRRMIDAGELRADLYYRLRGVEIHLPPLKERAADIPLLAEHFLAGSGCSLSPEALEMLGAMPWPGNVRELQNLIRNARAVAGTGEIGLGHLTAGEPAPAASAAPAQPGGQTLRERERAAILETLRACKGNRTQAARRLGIDRSTLRRKMREFEIGPGGAPES